MMMMNGDLAKRARAHPQKKGSKLRSQQLQVQHQPSINCDIDDVIEVSGRRSRKYICLPPREFIPRLLRPDKVRLMEEAKMRAGTERRQQRMANNEEIKVNMISSMQKNFKSRETVKKIPVVGQRSVSRLHIPDERTIAMKLRKVQKFHIQPMIRLREGRDSDSQ